MDKKQTKDPVVKARKKLARAQAEYLKIVAKGERQIRNVRAQVDENIARAKAEFDMRADELTSAEQSATAKNGTTDTQKIRDLNPAKRRTEEPNGALPASVSGPERPASKSGPAPSARKRSTPAADA